MAAKPQRSIRFEDEAFNGVLRVQLPDETFTATVNRVLLVGVDAIESETQAKPDKTQFETQTSGNETQTKPSETQAANDTTARYIQHLEDENARLVANIAEKDKQIFEALTRAHELASQSNAVALAAQERKQIPATTAGEEITVVMDGEEIAQETTDEPTQETTDEAPAQVETPVEEPRKRSLWERILGY